MGSTVTVSRRASAFRNYAGVFYGLFESTYEKNCYPHTPHEGCVVFGTAARVMQWICMAMESCEGGMLQRPGGTLTAAGYQRMWMTALAAPVALGDRRVRLKAGDGFGSTVPNKDGSWYEKNMVPFAAGKLRDFGYGFEAKALENGEEVLLSLHEHAEIVASIYGDTGGNGIAPWRILDPNGLGYSPDPSLAPPKLPARTIAMPATAVYSLERYDYEGNIVQGYDYTVALVEGYGSFYGHSVTSDLIRKVACGMEAKAYGAGLHVAESFRKLLAGNRPPAPGHLRVIIDLETPMTESYRAKLDGLAASLGSRARLTDRVLETSLGDLRDTNTLDLAMSLTYGNLRFEDPRGDTGDLLASTGDLFSAAA